MGVSKVSAGFGVNLGFSELVEVAEEFQNVRAAAVVVVVVVCLSLNPLIM